MPSNYWTIRLLATVRFTSIRNNREFGVAVTNILSICCSFSVLLLRDCSTISQWRDNFLSGSVICPSRWSWCSVTHSKIMSIFWFTVESVATEKSLITIATIASMSWNSNRILGGVSDFSDFQRQCNALMRLIRTTGKLVFASFPKLSTYW